MPEPENPYCGEELVKTVLGGSIDNGQVSWLRLCINAASREVEELCGQRFWLDAQVQTRDFIVTDDATRRVRLKASDDAGVAAGLGTAEGVVVKLDTGNNGGFATTLTEGTDYLLEPINADVAVPKLPFKYLGFELSGSAYYHPPRSPYGKPTLRVTGKWGWPAVPSQVELATALQAAQLFKSKDAVFGVAAFGDMGAIRVKSAMNPVAEDLLTPFMGEEFLGM